MTRQELKKIRTKWLDSHLVYSMQYWEDWNYSILDNIMYMKRNGRGSNTSFNDVIIMADTETSKKWTDDYDEFIDLDYEYILNEIVYYHFRWNDDFKEVASKREFKSVGINFNGYSYIDIYYEDLMERFPYIFEKADSDIEAIYNIYTYLKDNKPKEIEITKDNHVVAWTISIRSYNRNFVTLWGRKPSDFVSCVNKITNHFEGEDTFIYFHNLSYDWTFLRKFMMQSWGTPENQLNTKAHYPIYIKFKNGIIIKDSLILAQRGLEKWAKDLDVEHKKAVGKWDYDKIRNQEEEYTKDELEYIENDTLAGVECIQKTLDILNKNIATIPYTATGIPREAVRKLGRENGARNEFKRLALNFYQYLKCENIFHGGFVHSNRYFINTTISEDEEGLVDCYDFASSYPYVLLSEKFQCEAFYPYKHNVSPEFILKYANDYCFMFKLIIVGLDLKDLFMPMPPLQHYKCVKIINPVIDNGRVLQADYVEIYTNEIDLEVLYKYYTFNKSFCVEVEYAKKDYLPRWLTDYIFSLFKDKTMLKGGDPVAYAMAKAKLNSCYGMMVQKCIKNNIEEDYEVGIYETKISDPEELYQKYLDNHNTILSYAWGSWCTSYAMRNLFMLGECVGENGEWLYSDTDSCYAFGWDKEKIEAYNKKAKQKLIDNNYGCVEFNNREYWLGVAEFDGSYTEFRTLGAKRYCGRSTEDGELHITVAGVPKKNGAKCLKDDISNFTDGTVFDGETTGKMTHTYIYVDDIYIDKDGNETGDSIDLSKCDYLLDKTQVYKWSSLITEEINIQVYEEDLQKGTEWKNEEVPS